MKNIIHKIVQGDCLEKMKLLKDNSIDFICADFPYNISNNPWLTMKGDKIVKADFGDWDKWDNQEDYLSFVFEVCKEYQRILKPNASMVLFFSYRTSGWIAYELQRRGMFSFRSPIIFNKTNPMPHIRKNGFRSCHEGAVWLVNDGWKFDRPKTFNFLGQSKMKNVLNYKIGKEGNRQSNHPTEKPEFLIGGLIEIFTNPSDIVLDNFAGGWTTGVAAYKKGRHCISIEREPGYINAIRARQARAERRNNRG